MAPPPLGNLFPRITAFSNLLAAARSAQKCKRYRTDVLAFNANLEGELFRLQRELNEHSYVPGAYRRFHIRDPKPRVISAAPYRDRVVHHALCAVIGPPLERQFLATSYANRLGFGSHRALGKFARACQAHRWVLQIDIRLYFPSIDHQLLMAQLRRKITCSHTLWLLELILANGAEGGAAIDSFPGDSLLTPLERPRGLPIGNLTSQYLANLHLNDFDRKVRFLPGIRAYLRYVDDGALFADQAEPLKRARLLIEEELAALRLRLHPVKTQIRRTRDGASFVGFHVIRRVIRIRNHNLLRGRRRLRAHALGVAAGLITAEAARASLQSWSAHLSHGHTHNLRRRLFQNLSFAPELR
ncbi:MAG: reverse transcriptase domain-containing protein [Cyanobacteriota bacterium]|jgi:RNA-directed DNA polymerase